MGVVLNNFQGDRHALYSGWVLGAMIAEGYVVRAVVDGDGDYLPRVRFIAKDPAMSIELDIPEPPDDWALV